MSDNFKLQLSVKIDGAHLLNVRSDSSEEFGTLLKWTVENAVQLQAACAALEGKVPVIPVPTTRRQEIASPGASSGETGPVTIDGVQKDTRTKDGRPMKSPRYTIKFSNGKKLSTFDETLALSAESLGSVPVVYTTVTNGEYVNLASMRRA